MRLFVDNYVQTRYVDLYNDKVTRDLKFMVIGDVHISDMVSLKKLDLLKERIIKEKADYYLFVGDLIDNVDDIGNADLLYKVNDLLSLTAKVAPTFVILGNHDYIQKKTKESNIDGISQVIKGIDGVTLLDNDIYCDDNVWLMGYTETKKYYHAKKYDFEEFYEDLKKMERLYKNVRVDLPTLALVHSPEFSNDDKCVSLFKDYDLILCGHTHDGCIPFGFGNFKRGLISPKKTLFPKNVRGLRKLDNNYILITGGVTKIQKCAPKILHPFNHLCPVQVDVVMLRNKDGVSIRKKWY